MPSFNKLSAAIFFALAATSATFADTAPSTASAPAVSEKTQDANAAEVLFNVASASTSPLARGKENADELAIYIQTQIVLFKTPELYDQVFLVKEVQESTWFRQFKNKQAAVAALNDALNVQPVPKTSLIRVTLTINERREVDMLLNKIAEQYINWRDQIEAVQRERDIKAFRDQLNMAEKNLIRAQTDSDDFRSLHDVGSMTKALDIANAVLLDQERELTKLTTDRTLMQAMVDNVTESQKNPKYELPTDYVQMIEGDATYRSLDDLRMSLERAREVAVKDKGDTPESKKITTELEVTNKQLKERYEKLAARAKEQQLSSVIGALSTINARILDVKKKHDEKQAEVRKLDNDLVAYRSREDSVKAARAEFDRVQTEFNKQDGILRSAQSRIQFVSRARPVAP